MNDGIAFGVDELCFIFLPSSFLDSAINGCIEYERFLLMFSQVISFTRGGLPGQESNGKMCERLLIYAIVHGSDGKTTSILGCGGIAGTRKVYLNAVAECIIG